MKTKIADEEIFEAISTLRGSIRWWVNRVNGNPDGTVFIGRSEIQDLATKCWTTPSAVGRAINRVVSGRLEKTKAIRDGGLGYQIPRGWF